MSWDSKRGFIWKLTIVWTRIRNNINNLRILDMVWGHMRETLARETRLGSSFQETWSRDIKLENKKHWEDQSIYGFHNST